MGRGRKPKPTAEKKAAGNPGNRPLNENEPEIQPGIPEMPDHLRPDAVDAWNQICERLGPTGILTKVDGLALEMLVEAYADLLTARKAIADFGSEYYTTTNAEGSVMHRAHPAVAIVQDADRRVRSWASEFGMTPSARSKVKVDGNKRDENPADKYFT